MENNYSEVRVLSAKEKFVNGMTKFGHGFVQYCKKNWFAFVVGGLMILFLLLMIAPAASIRVNRFEILGAVFPGASDGEVITKDLKMVDGFVDFHYNAYDLIAGRAENIKLDGGNADASYFAYFTFNFWILLGLLFLLGATVCVFVNRKTPRIVAAVLGFVGITLVVSFFQYSTGVHTFYQNSCIVNYTLDWNAGYYLLIIVGQLVELGCIAVCVYDLYKRHKHAESETERYMRGGE